MSKTRTLKEKLKSAQTVTSISGMSTLLVNTLGELAKTGAIKIDLTARVIDLNEVTESCILAVKMGSTNLPVDATVALVCIVTELSIFHIVLRGGNGGEIYFRAHSSTGWGGWWKLSMTAVV